jgi:hypothetical protein
MPLSKIKTNSISNPVALTAPVIDGVGYTPFNFRNKFINGNFDFWQRSTSATLTGSGYPAPDRWAWIYDGTSSSTNTVSRQTFALGQTDVPGNPKYFMQYTYGVTSTPNNYFRQNIESVLTLAGKTCTVSFWARCTSGTVSCSYQNQQEFGGGGSPSSGVYGIGTTSFTLTTTWQKFVITHTLPSITGKTVGTTYDGSMNPSFYFPTNAGNTVQFAQMQFEEGSVATPFEERPLGLELQLCQRYCMAYTAGGDTNYTYFSIGQAMSSTETRQVFIFKQTMRALPTATTSAPNTFIWDAAGGGITVTALSLDRTTTQGGTLTTTVASSSVAVNGCVRMIQNATTSCNVIFSAEL